MNKNTISWLHYAYATITASVLAYVTVMDTNDSQMIQDNAVDMLPTFNSNEEINNDPVEDSVEDTSTPFEEDIPVYDETTDDVSIMPEPVIAEPVLDEPSESAFPKGGKLKKNKTKNKQPKRTNNKTRNHK